MLLSQAKEAYLIWVLLAGFTQQHMGPTCFMQLTLYGCWVSYFKKTWILGVLNTQIELS